MVEATTEIGGSAFGSQGIVGSIVGQGFLWKLERID